MQSREQQYAASVYARVESFRAQHSDERDRDRKRYGSMAHKLPILVRQAGLVQALAFIQSRNKAPTNQLLDDLAQTVGANTTANLLDRSRRANLVEYIYLTDQVMLALKWYKRFAQSVLKVDPTDDDDGGGDE
ncbi:MAG: type III-B CRISPR module-associated protein Cmr5 [Anaerolineae bacterium]